MGRYEYGIIVLDQRSHRDDSTLRDVHEQLVNEQGIWTSKYKNLIEGVFLAPSHYGVGIQFADMVAGAVHRYFEHHDATWFDLIAGSFRASPSGQIDGYGLAKVPKGKFV